MHVRRGLVQAFRRGNIISFEEELQKMFLGKKGDLRVKIISLIEGIKYLNKNSLPCRMNLTEATLHLQNDPEFKKVIETTTLPSFSPSGNVYYDLLDSIVSQQLSGKVAATIFNRFLSLFPDRNPRPALLVDMPFEQLRGIGLSAQKTSYLQNVAKYAIENDIDNNIWHNKSDIEIINELSRIKGVGQWTVEMILIFTLGRPDVLPIDDLGIQQAMINLCGFTETGKSLKNKMIERAEPWRPWRSLATRYLWRWKDTVKQ